MYSQFLLLFFNFVHIVLTSSPWRFHFNIISLVFVRTSEHCGLGGGSDASSGCRRSAGPSLELVLLVLWAVPSVVCCYGPSPWTRPLIQRAPKVSTACRSSPWLRPSGALRCCRWCCLLSSFPWRNALGRRTPPVCISEDTDTAAATISPRMTAAASQISWLGCCLPLLL